MATTELALIEPSGFLALHTDLANVTEVIEENLGGQDVNERDLVRLTVPSGDAKVYRWEVPTLDGSDAVEEISGVIVHKTQTRQFWPVPLEEGGGGQPPSCSSPDARIGFGKPWATKANPDPEGEPERRVCKTCPNAQFAPGGGPQPCSERANLFLLMETGYLPAVVSVPPTSLKPLKQYMMALSNAGVPYISVVTAFTLEKSESNGTPHAVIKPRRVGPLSPEAIAAAKAYAAALRPQFEAITFDAPSAAHTDAEATATDEPAAEMPEAA